MTDLVDKLLPCPFCGEHLKISRGKINKHSLCATPDCWMSDRAIAVPLDDFLQVKQWNTRATINYHCKAPQEEELIDCELKGLGKLKREILREIFDGDTFYPPFKERADAVEEAIDILAARELISELRNEQDDSLDNIKQAIVNLAHAVSSFIGTDKYYSIYDILYPNSKEFTKKGENR